MFSFSQAGVASCELWLQDPNGSDHCHAGLPLLVGTHRLHLNSEMDRSFVSAEHDGHDGARVASTRSIRSKHAGIETISLPPRPTLAT
jgi:hypothetical protein